MFEVFFEPVSPQLIQNSKQLHISYDVFEFAYTLLFVLVHVFSEYHKYIKYVSKLVPYFVISLFFFFTAY